MIDINNEYLEEISKSLYNMNADELSRAESRACAYYYGLHKIINRKTADFHLVSSSDFIIQFYHPVYYPLNAQCRRSDGYVNARKVVLSGN